MNESFGRFPESMFSSTCNVLGFFVFDQ